MCSLLSFYFHVSLSFDMAEILKINAAVYVSISSSSCEGVDFYSLIFTSLYRVACQGCI